MKPVHFLGNALACLREFPDAARQNAGYQLDRLQHGLQPSDSKPMTTIGRGVEEIRIRDATGSYRVIYIARRADAVYVLHAFQKKSQATARHDIDLARQRLNQLLRGKP
ncbi:type II toxin-antitoxin system RelE/ParE family toxin [Aquitalea sp. LB_tupeE]|uniref:type II toxin-antitoxin system RelE/ParE family toxin n=1 Tax=Aquitalea sp. LB_tupeE TaxID=2748078 RepID=UPI0015BFA0C1|nr:type II toxin-antitoxin system RelE/ParE family toxin [Aquitalea sp. LB_tupeE]NWK79798.1 type II toxin-antitoxin system RelE/ParE family toxin [Aquitalea sp. LB_tupeE]